jgi:hypothetical protein
VKGHKNGEDRQAESRPKKKKKASPASRALVPVKAKKSRRTGNGAGFDSLSKLLEHPLVAELISVGAIAAVAAIADHNVKTRTGEGKKGSRKALKAAGKRRCFGNRQAADKRSRRDQESVEEGGALDTDEGQAGAADAALRLDLPAAGFDGIAGSPSRSPAIRRVRASGLANRLDDHGSRAGRIGRVGKYQSKGVLTQALLLTKEARQRGPLLERGNDWRG